MKGLGLILKREGLLYFRRRMDCVNPLLFFVIVCCLFPLATTPNVTLLALMGPGVIWASALLATLLSLNKLFLEDFHDGCLDQLLLSPMPLPVLVLGKIIMHWLVFGLPLVLVSPLLGMMFHLSSAAIKMLVFTLLLGTPILSFVGAIAAALTVSVRNGGMLLALLLLPIYMPILIFGSMAVAAANMGLPVAEHILLLGSLLVLAITLAPLTVSAALRV